MTKAFVLSVCAVAASSAVTLLAAEAPKYVDPVAHDVITQPYRVCQNLEELTSRINNLYRKPFHKLFDKSGVAQSEVVYFKDVTSGHEVMSLTRELCNDIAHSDLGRPVWTADGKRILFMGNRGYIGADGEFAKSAWPGHQYFMLADYSGQRQMIVTYLDESGNVTQRSDGIPGKFNIMDPRDPRQAYYAVEDTLWRLTLGEDGGENRAQSICKFSTKWRKIIQAISRDGKLLIQDVNADLDRSTKKPQYMPEIHLIDLNRKPGEAGFYYHHPFDYGLPELKDEKGKIVHAADNNYQFHSLMFGATSNSIGWNYGPMTDVGEYLGWTLNVSNGLDGKPTHGKITSGAGTNAWGQYESHGRTIGMTTKGLYFSGPAVLGDGKKVGGYGLWLRDYADPGTAPRFLTAGPGGHVAGGNSISPDIYAAHISAPSAQWRKNVKECDAIVWGDLRGKATSVLCYTYSDVRGGIRKDRNTGKLVWSGMDNNDFRPYASVPRPLLSPDATKLWFHSCMLQPYEEYTGIYVAVTGRPESPRNLQLSADAKTGKVALQWQRPTIGSEIKGYHLYRGDAEGRNVVELTSEAVNALQAIDNSAQVGQTYTYVVTSEEWSTLESDKSSNALVVTVAADKVSAKSSAAITGWDKVAPPLVEDFGATKEPDEAGQYRLRWKKNPANDLRYYNVYFSSTERPAAIQKRLVVSPNMHMTEYLDWSAPLEGAAHYAITAVDRQGNESAPVYADVP